MILLLKLTIIATITAIAFTLVAYLLWLSDTWPMQAVALLVWSCGAVLFAVIVMALAGLLAIGAGVAMVGGI